ncbi:MAG TPA: FliI/YscN family ATPase [Balneolales bacterium]|nr:FliI/YscN family ATPase [Balneolales bacterium]
MMLEHISEISRKFDDYEVEPKRYGKVSSIIGTVIEATGLRSSLGELHVIHASDDSKIMAEVVGIKDRFTLLMPLDRIDGLRTGCLVEALPHSLTIKVGHSLLGRVVDANANPIDKKGPIQNVISYSVHNDPPGPMERDNIEEMLYTGIRSIDAFNSVGLGQRLGIFAGSGVGKSVTMGMIAKRSSADINVIALIGERGREVKEFIENVLGPEGLKRSVVVATTSDKAAMSRVKAAFTATAIAEYFRDIGNNVLLIMDSVTRVAMAQREIGLASGEPPTTKGYTPSVFTLLPKILERAGKTPKGSITGLYTVLVDNDDMNEPIADAVRSILDGHVVLSRHLAHKNHYPAVDVLESISRVMPQVTTPQQRQLSHKARELLAIYKDAEDLINIGAYVDGSNKKIDEAKKKIDHLNGFLRQNMDEDAGDYALWEQLTQIVNEPDSEGDK